MNESNLAKTITDLMRHSKISELESLDISLLRQLENQADKDLEAASEMLDWIEAITSGRLLITDDSGNMEKQADIAVVNASNRLQWISSIIDKKLGVESAGNGTEE
ncbi:MAG: hypothetical protein EB060_02145 [Proteobacteria bacterium]|nr:hypothetical protein [Pseudomonadota bacterium]